MRHRRAKDPCDVAPSMRISANARGHRLKVYPVVRHRGPSRGRFVCECLGTVGALRMTNVDRCAGRTQRQRRGPISARGDAPGYDVAPGARISACARGCRFNGHPVVRRRGPSRGRCSCECISAVAALRMTNVDRCAGRTHIGKRVRVPIETSPRCTRQGSFARPFLARVPGCGGRAQDDKRGAARRAYPAPKARPNISPGHRPGHTHIGKRARTPMQCSSRCTSQGSFARPFLVRMPEYGGRARDDKREWVRRAYPAPTARPHTSPGHRPGRRARGRPPISPIRAIGPAPADGTNR